MELMRERAQFFTQAEQEILMEAVKNVKALYALKAILHKRRKLGGEKGWQKVADKLNA